jgi:ELWxxDGT repeat protein
MRLGPIITIMISWSRAVVLLSLGCLVGSGAFGQSVRRLADLRAVDPSWEFPRSAPRDFVAQETGTLFVATTVGHGRELWKTDGTRESTNLVRDLCPGDGFCVERIVAPFGNGRWLFRGSHGLGVSDGTADGTRFLGIAVEDLLVFRGTDGVERVAFRGGCTDGPCGISIVDDGLGGLSRLPFSTLGATWYAAGDGGVTVLVETSDRVDLWVVNGGPETARQLGSFPGFAVSGEIVSLDATRWAAILRRGEESSLLLSWNVRSTAIEHATVMPGWRFGLYSSFVIDGRAYFVRPSEALTVFELWRTDGTETGLEQLGRFDSDLFANEVPAGGATAGGLAVFMARGVSGSMEVWTVGSSANSLTALSGCPGGCPTRVEKVAGLGSLAYVLAKGPEGGPRLFVTDGSGPGTSLLAAGEDLAIVGSVARLLFYRLAGALWSFDQGSGKVRRLLHVGSADVAVGAGPGVATWIGLIGPLGPELRLARPRQGARLVARLDLPRPGLMEGVLAANSRRSILCGADDQQWRLWSVESGEVRAIGTGGLAWECRDTRIALGDNHLLAEIAAGAEARFEWIDLNSRSSRALVTPAGFRLSIWFPPARSYVFWRSVGGSTELYRSSGGPPSAVPFATIPGELVGASISRRALFVSTTRGLYQFDAALSVAKPIGSSLDPYGLPGIKVIPHSGGWLLVDGSGLAEFLPRGSRQALPIPLGEGAHLLDAAPIGSGSVVLRMGWGGRYELWAVQGVTATMVGGFDRALGRFAGLSERVVFAAGSVATGLRLWGTDGTEAGTQLLQGGEPGFEQGVFLPPVSFNGGAVFGGYTLASGVEPWFTDGTSKGTRLLADVWAGPYSGLRAVGWQGARDMLVLAADDGTTGVEPWGVQP